MRKLFLVLLSVTLVIGLIHPAVGWDFSLRGSHAARFSSFGTFLPKPSFASTPNQRPADCETASRFTAPGSRGTGAGMDRGPICGSYGQRGIGLCRIGESSLYCSSKLSFRPELSVTDSADHKRYFSISGVYSVAGFGNEPGNFASDMLSSSIFPGSPPFDRYYYGYPQPLPQNLSAGSWEQFWFTLSPNENTKIRLGAGDLPTEAGATLRQSGAKDILAARLCWTDGWRTDFGGCAVFPSNRLNGDLARPIPSGPLWLLGYTVAYTAITAAYVGVTAACYTVEAYVRSFFGLLKTEDSEKAKRNRLNGTYDAWQTKRDCLEKNATKRNWISDNVCEFLLGPETDREPASGEAGKKGKEAHAPCRIYDIVSDYSTRMGNRKPLYFVTLENYQPCGSAGMGLFWYSHLDELVSEPQPKLDKRDDSALVFSLYGRYNDGRLFANVHYSVFGWDVFPKGAPHRFHRGFHLFSEAGGLVGPAKASLMFACSSGKPLEDSEEGRRRMRYPINHKLMAPYEFLMFQTYGGGNQTFEGLPGDRHGMMSDAYALGGRVDVDVAANLNLWTSCFWSWRMEPKGAFLGQYTDFETMAPDMERRISAISEGYPTTPPALNYGYVSDQRLGYELNAGADWKLSHTATVSVQAAYWRPGDWFKGALAPHPGSQSWAQNDLPAIVGLKCSLMTEF